MKRIILLLIFLFAFSAIPAQTAASDGTATVFLLKNLKNPKFRQMEIDKKQRKILEKYLARWIRDNNKRSRGVFIYKFDGFVKMPEDLRKNLDQAFPDHRFTIAGLSIFHKAWFKTNYLFLSDRKTGKIINFAVNPLGGQLNPFEFFGDVLTTQPARDADDALFRVKTFAEILVFAHGSRIRRIEQSAAEISILFCLASSGVEHYGRMMTVKITPEFRFEHPNLESNYWLPNQCEP